MDKSMLAVIVCLVVAIGLIMGIWWYYDSEMNRMEQNLRRSAPHSVKTEE